MTPRSTSCRKAAASACELCSLAATASYSTMRATRSAVAFRLSWPPHAVVSSRSDLPPQAPPRRLSRLQHSLLLNYSPWARTRHASFPSRCTLLSRSRSRPRTHLPLPLWHQTHRLRGCLSLRTPPRAPRTQACVCCLRHPPADLCGRSTGPPRRRHSWCPRRALCSRSNLPEARNTVRLRRRSGRCRPTRPPPCRLASPLPTPLRCPRPSPPPAHRAPLTAVSWASPRRLGSRRHPPPRVRHAAPLLTRRPSCLRLRRVGLTSRTTASCHPRRRRWRWPAPCRLARCPPPRPPW